MKRFCAFLLILTISSCDAADERSNAESVDAAPDSVATELPEPFEEEFLVACTAEPNNTPSGFYGSDKITPDTYCACIFDTTMRGLSEDEKLVAAFYLLGQSGIDTRNRPEFRQIDPMAMMAGSEAVGRAVNRCG